MSGLKLLWRCMVCGERILHVDSVTCFLCAHALAHVGEANMGAMLHATWSDSVAPISTTPVTRAPIDADRRRSLERRFADANRHLKAHHLDPRAWLLFGETALLLGDVDNAMLGYWRAIELYRAERAPLKLLAVVRQALAIRPRDLLLWLVQARACLEIGARPRARAAALIAISVSWPTPSKEALAILLDVLDDDARARLRTALGR